MKLADLYQEHERADALVMTKDTHAHHLKVVETGEKLQLTFAGNKEGSGNYIIFRQQYDGDHHTLAFANRLKQDEPEGYIILARTSSTERWEVLAVWLKPELRGLGLVTNLYRALSSEGYKLKSGASLTQDAEKVWLALGRAGVAKVLDAQTGNTEDFSDKPIGDGDMVAGTMPRYYWVTEGKKLLTYCTTTGPMSGTAKEAWLSGKEATPAAIKENKELLRLLGAMSMNIGGEI
jgi:hypothetical protein